MMKHLIRQVASLTMAFFLVVPGLAGAQEPVGIVTALKGTARLTRTGNQSNLKFRDNLVIRDVIETQESSLVRVLFGGKSTVTVRELSRLEVTEELVPGGGIRSVHNLSSGSVLVNVARRLMKKGDEVVIRTPNAVGAVRGTIIFAQYNPSTSQSTFTLLTGSAIVTPQGQPPVTLTPDTAVTVSGDAAVGVQAGPVTAISKSESNEILQESDTGVTVTEEANQEQTAEAQTEEAVQLAEAVVEMTTGESTSTTSETEQTSDGTTEEGEAESTEQNSETTESSTSESTSEGTDTTTSESTTTETQTATAESTTDGTSTTSTESTTTTTTESTTLADSTTSTDPTLDSTTTTTTESTTTETLVTSGGTGDTITETTQSAQVTLNGETKNLGGDTLYIFDGTSSLSVDPLIDVVNSNIDQTSGTSLVLVSSGADATVGGTLLRSDPSTITAAGDIFRVDSGANLTLSGSLFNDLDGTITAGLGLLYINGGTVTGTGGTPFIVFKNSIVSLNDVVVSMNGGSMTLSGPLAKITGGSLSATNLLDLSNGASLVSNGPLLDATNLTLNLGSQSLIEMANFSSLTNNSGPLLKLTGSSLTADALVSSDNSGNVFDFTGPILDLTNSTVTLNSLGHDPESSTNFDHFTLNLQNSDPMFLLDNSTLHLTGISANDELISLDGEDLLSAVFDGTALIAKNNSVVINDGGGLLDMSGVFSTTTTNPLVEISSSSVSTKLDSMFDIHVESGGSTNITMAGPLASVGSTLNSKTNLFQISGGAFLSSSTSSPLFDFNNATINVGGPTSGHMFEAANGHLMLAGPLMQASTSSINLSDSLFKVFGGSQIHSTISSPLIKLTSTPVTPIGSSGLNYLLHLEGFGSTVGISDILFKAQNSDLTFNSSLVKVFNGGQIQTMSTKPVVELQGGNHGVGVHLMTLSGVNIDPTYMTGSDQPVIGTGGTGFVTPSGAEAFNPIGTLFKATNGANVNVGGNAVRLDTALYEATLPVVELIGTNGGSMPDTILTSNNAFAEVIRSRIVLERPFASLDRGLINVTNGPFLHVSNGSQMFVADSLLKLTNGSKINVVNGPLIEVSGTGSLLDIGGALVEFGGLGGNQIVVRNNMCSPSCTLLKGVPILTATGGVVNIPGNNPVLNPSLGIIDTTSTDAVIKAVDSGIVNIAAP